MKHLTWMMRALCVPGSQVVMESVMPGKAMLRATLVQPGEPELKGDVGLSCESALVKLEEKLEADAKVQGLAG